VGDRQAQPLVVGVVVVAAALIGVFFQRLHPARRWPASKITTPTQELPLDLSLVPTLAGLLIPLAGIAFPVIVIVVVLQFRERQRKQLYDTVKHYADRGMPVPRELIEPPRRSSLNTPRYGAFTVIGLGLGLVLMFWSLELPSLMGIGGLLVCVGAAQLIALALDAREARHSGAPPAPRQDA
jgi:hypothetical protein